MKSLSGCFALAVLPSMFATVALAQTPLDENKDYQAFKSWAIDTQMKEYRGDRPASAYR